DNLDDILSVKGLDAIYVGPSDLSISLGYNPGGDKPDEWMMTALKKILDGCKRHKVQPGIHCGAPAYALKMIEMGFSFVTVGGDTRFATMGAAAAVQEMRPGGAAQPGVGASSSRPYGAVKADGGGPGSGCRRGRRRDDNLYRRRRVPGARGGVPGRGAARGGGCRRDERVAADPA